VPNELIIITNSTYDITKLYKIAHLGKGKELSESSTQSRIQKYIIERNTETSTPRKHVLIQKQACEKNQDAWKPKMFTSKFRPPN
jgi:hypothetical protein